MTDLNRQPSLTKIIKNYEYGILLILFPIIFLGFFVVVDVLGLTIRRRGVSVVSASGLPVFLILAVVTGIIAIVLIKRQIDFVRKLFANGQEVIGQITKVALNSTNGGGYVYFSYWMNNQEYDAKVGIAGRIIGERMMRSLSVGNELILVVDPAMPKRALIKDLYL